MDPLRLPWEVIERVIDHSARRPKTLRCLTLTCLQLLPRTRLVMFGRVRLKNTDQVFDFIDFLYRNPHLSPVVRSVVFSPSSFGPSILHMLPNLPSIDYVSDGSSKIPDLPMHHISLACFGRLGHGNHIRTLRLSKLSFPTSLAFAQLLLTIRSTTNLVCEGLKVEAIGDQAHLNVLRRRLSDEVHLTAVTIDYESLWTESQRPQRVQTWTGGHWIITSAPSVHIGELLFHPKSMVKKLVLRGIIDVSLTKFLSYDCDWSGLRSLVLQLIVGGSGTHHRVEEALKLLENFRRCPSLKEVTLEWQIQSLYRLVEAIPFYDAGSEGQVYGNELEDALLRFSHPRLMLTVTEPSANNASCWDRELQKYFSVLSRRGLVGFKLKYSDNIPPGHDYWVEALAVSPDSKWVASGSQDSTIILWDAKNATIVHQWVAQSCKAVRVLAFSPDSQYLLSGGEDHKAVIWDVNHGRDVRKVATLEGHAGIVSRCAWSPSANTLATGSEDGTMRLWNAHTFRALTLHALKGRVRSLTFSPNGCWLAVVSDTGESCVVNVALDMPDTPLSDRPLSNTLNDYPCMPCRKLYVIPYPIASAAFDPGSTRLAVGLYALRPGINIIDVETGNSLLPRQREGKQYVYDISFSPDGKLVLGAAGLTAHVWDAATGEEVFRLGGHEYEIRAARFSPCGEYIGSASTDETVRLWRTNDGACVARLSEHRYAVHHVVFSPDAKTLASADCDGRVIIRRKLDDIPQTHRPDNHQVRVAASTAPPPADSIPNPTSLQQDRTRLSADEEVARVELRHQPDREGVGVPEEQHIKLGVVDPGGRGLRTPGVGASNRPDHQDEDESVKVSSAVADAGRTTVDAGSSLEVALAGAKTAPPMSTASPPGSTSRKSLGSRHVKVLLKLVRTMLRL